VPFGPFPETLPPSSGRYVYRVRRADAAGNLSAGGAMARVVVRVPSLAPGAAPDREPAGGADAPGTLRLRIAPEPELTCVLAFSQVSPNDGGPVRGADLLRVPNAPDLYPNRGIRLRAPDGTILVPQIKLLADPDVTTDAAGFRHLSLSFSGGAGQRVRVWACTLTRDGISSLLGGPWSLALPAPALPIPTLAVLSAPPQVVFSWSWPPGPRYNVALQRSADGVGWQRVSPPLAETATTYSSTQPAGSWRYRLLVMAPDGRTSASNIVTP
jgi:hypothetical protein